MTNKEETKPQGQRQKCEPYRELSNSSSESENMASFWKWCSDAPRDLSLSYALAHASASCRGACQTREWRAAGNETRRC